MVSAGDMRETNAAGNAMAAMMTSIAPASDAPHAPQQNETAVTQLQPLTDGVDHVGVVLLRRKLNHVGVVGPVAQGVEVPHRQVGVDAVGHQGVEAQVGGDYVVPLGGIGAQVWGQGHSPHNIADTGSGTHGAHSFSAAVYFCFLLYTKRGPFARGKGIDFPDGTE